MKLFRPLALGAVFFCAAAAQAAPEAGITGSWNRDDGRGGIRIARCGSSYCGDVTWLRDKGGPGHIGQRVFFDMRQTGPETWTGLALNPEDGKTYSGTLTLAGSHMMTRGCALGGMICASLGLTRAH